MKFIFTPPLRVPAIPEADLKLSREAFNRKYQYRRKAKRAEGKTCR